MTTNRKETRCASSFIKDALFIVPRATTQFLVVTNLVCIEFAARSRWSSRDSPNVYKLCDAIFVFLLKQNF